jgi:hypothetical protein
MSNTTIQLKKSGQTGNTPADLNYGEVAINYADGKLFYKNGVGIKAIENQKTFSTVNANNSLIIATTPTDILSLVAGNNIQINTNTTSKTVTINAVVDNTVAFAAYTQANTASANTVYLQTINDNQNTNITSVNTFTQAAYNKANNALANTSGAIFGGDLLIGAGGKLNVLTVGGDEGGEILLGKAVSNTTLDGVGVTIDVYQNKIRFFEQGGSARGFYLDISTGGGGASTNIMSGGGGGGSDTVAFAAYAQANTASANTVYLQTVNNNQNTSISSANTLAQAAFDAANTASANTVYLQTINNNQNTSISSANTLATAAYAQANSASGNTVALQSQMTTTNTNITSVNTFAQAAFNTANNGVNLATAAFSAANTAAANTVYLQTINNNQNTSITNVNTFAQAAYNTANLKFNTSGGSITGNTTIQQNLVVEGDLSVLGNSVTIGTSSLVVEDSLIFLANGNITTDAVDIGVVGHYNPGSGVQHTGIFRDPNLKEWILFQGYTPEIQANNLINLSDSSFRYANLYANVIKSNVISTYITVNGLDVNNTMTNAWNTANNGVTLATAAYGAANTAAANTVYLQTINNNQNTSISAINTLALAAYGKANAEGEINNTQNTNITSVNTFAGSAFNTANTAAANTVYLQTINNNQNTSITNVNTFTQAAFDEANGAVQTGFTTISANTVSITPASNADTLTISAGNNISISACTTTKTITINSTASGGGSSGGFTYNIAPPATGNTAGDRWVDSNDGTLYTYVNDGNSLQWVDLSTAAVSSSIGGGSTNAILYQAGVGNTTFTSVGSQGQLLMAGVGGVPIWAAQTALRIANTQITGLITSSQIATVANTQITGTIGATITDDTTTATTLYPLFEDATSGTLTSVSVSSTKLTYVPSTGTLSSTIVTSTSDEKLKENIVTISNPIDTIKKLRGVEYNWKDNGNKSMGVIAQEVEKVLPYLVSENENGKTVMYQNMVGLLIEAIKEQQKQIDELRGKLDAN